MGVVASMALDPGYRQIKDIVNMTGAYYTVSNNYNFWIPRECFYARKAFTNSETEELNVH